MNLPDTLYMDPVIMTPIQMLDSVSFIMMTPFQYKTFQQVHIHIFLIQTQVVVGTIMYIHT